MLRWIAILLIAALPIRSGMAAAQICPWMAVGISVQATSVSLVTTAATTTDTMGDDCPGMSVADGH
jgi:hypothetical protein